MALKVKLLRSLEGRSPQQRGTIAGLGLKKINSEKVLNDTPSIRGMIKKVAHMVELTTVTDKVTKRTRTKRPVAAENK